VVSAGITNVPGWTGRINAIDESKAYWSGERTSPKWPKLPPPRLERKDFALALISFSISLRVSALREFF